MNINMFVYIWGYAFTYIHTYKVYSRNLTIHVKYIFILIVESKYLYICFNL